MLLEKKAVKKIIKKTRLASAITIICSLVVLPTMPVLAANSMSVTPGFIHVSITAEQNVQDTAVALLNNNDQTLDYDVGVVDVDTLSPKLTPLNTSVSYAAKAVTIKNTMITLQPHQSVNVLLSINGAQLVAGGQYAALVIKQRSQLKDKSIPLQQAVAVTLFLTKEEGAVRKIDLTSSTPKGILFHRPLITEVTYKNSGNTDITPRVVATVERGNTVLAKAISSSTSLPLLAGQKDTVQLTNVFNTKYGFGMYQYQVQYRYDGQSIPSVVESTFWYIPVWYFCTVLVGVASLVYFVIVRRKQIQIMLKKTFSKKKYIKS